MTPARSGLVIYGATGFTGRLIAELAAQRWHARPARGGSPLWARPPLLAGRDADKLMSLAASLGLPWEAACLDDRPRVDALLSQRAFLVNAAGPFAATAESLAKACLRTRTHYLDVSGEFGSFRRVDDLNVDATQLGVMLMPGAGFVLAASDFLLAEIRDAMPDVRTVRVAVSTPSRLSRGSLATLLETSREGVAVRRAGGLTTVPIGQLERAFVFADEDFGTPVLCAAVQLPDLVSARVTAGTVENVETYAEADTLRRLWFQVTGVAAMGLQLDVVKRTLRSQISRLPDTTTLSHDGSSRQVFVVEGEDAYGARTLRARIEADDTYRFTAWSVLALAECAAERVRRTSMLPGGFRTPAGVFHAELRAALRDCGCAKISPLRAFGLGARRARR